MASIDQLQIEIQAQDKASATLNDLSQSMENLGRALERLDASKVTSFARAMDKLSGIGANTNVTTKGIKDLANELSNSFGIRTKKGVDDLKKSITALYEVNKQQKQGFDTGDAYDSAIKGVQNAIEANYKYKVSLDETTKSVKDYVDATNKSGAKIGMADMKQEFGENFKEMASVLGGSFKNDLDSAKEGVQDLAEYLSEMNNQLGTNFDTQNVEKGFSDLVETVRNAKEVILDYKEASKQGLISDRDVFDGVVTAIERVNELYREQEKYGATNGLGGIVGVLNQLGNINLPDLNSFVSAAKDIGTNAPRVQEVSQSVKDIGDAATQATTQVEGLNDALRQSHIVIEGNEKVEHGFTMKDAPQYQNVEYPPMVVEQAQAFEEKLLPAIIDTENEISNLYQHMMSLSGVEAAYDAITEKFVEWKTQLMEMNGAISGDKWIVPEFSGNADFSRQQVGWISNIKPEVVEGYFYQIEDAANKCLPAIQNVGTTALALPDQFKTSTDYINQCLETMKGDVEGVGQSVPESFGKVEQGAKKAASDIEKATQAAREFKKVISDMESGKIDFDKDKFDAAVKGYEQASEAIKNYKNALLGVEEKQAKKTEVAKPAEMGNVLENIIALGEAFESLGSKLNAVGDKGIKLFKTLTTPLRMAANEYKEKFEHMGEVVSNFQKNFKVHMDKIAQFWKRTMKTFTFMLVRKAITAIIKEVGNAVQSLAMYSNAMGTAFNTDISNMIADFQYLGRSIVSVFAPLLNIIAPIIDAIVSKIATLLSYIGMFIAALGGKNSFTKAKKNVDNYAESLDDASKSAKNLTMGIDELNILSDQKSSSKKSPTAGWEDAWEDVEIPDWIKNLADKFKNLIDKLLAPIKEAWARVKENFLLAWEYMITRLKDMFKAIGEAFLEVWNEEKTIETIQRILNSIANIMLTIGNLAENFTKAWVEAERGVQIFEKLRDIIYVLVVHFEDLTSYMFFWSQGVTFDNLLDSIIELLTAFETLADFLGGVFYDVMTRVVLDNIEWLIEDGIPHLNKTIAEIINSFNFDKIREDLQIVEDAFSRLFKNIDIGTTNAIGNLGKEIAAFTNSQEFTNFMQRIADIMDLISAEDVEKVLTGIGKGVLSIANSVIKFVNSDTFMSFLEALDRWLENASADDIANIMTNLATAIAMFKFAAFASEGFAGFLKFAAVIKGLTDLHTIAVGLTGVGEGASAAAGGVGALGTAFAEIIAVIAIVSGVIYSLITSFGGLDNTLQYIGGVFSAVGERLANFAERLKLGEHIETLKQKFEGLLEALGNQRHFWEILINIIGLVADVIGGALVIAFDTLVQVMSGVIDFVTGVIEIFGGFFDMLWSAGEIIVGIVTDDLPLVEQGVDDFVQSLVRIGEGLLLMLQGFVEQVLGYFGGIVNGLFEAFMGILSDLGLFSEEWETKIRSWWNDKVLPWFTWDRWVQLALNIASALGELIARFVAFVSEWATKIQSWWNEHVAPWFTIEKWAALISSVKQSLDNVITNFGTFANNWKTSIQNWWNEHVAPWFTLEKWAELISSIVQSLENIITSFGTFVDNWKLSIENWWNENVAPWFTWDKWAELGHNLVEGLFGGIKERWENAAEDSAIGKWLIEKFRTDTDEHSPSRKAHELGDDFILGLFEPFTATRVAELSVFTDALLDLFRTNLSPDKFTEIGTQIIEGLIQPIRDSIPTFNEAITAVFEGIMLSITTNVPILTQTVLTEMQTLFTTINETLNQHLETLKTNTVTFIGTFFDELNLLISSKLDTATTLFETKFDAIKTVVSTKLDEIKTIYFEKLTAIFGGEGLDVDTPIANLFMNVTAAITYQLEVLGATLTELMATFFETYIMPYFSNDIWQPLFDLLHEETIVPNWENFLVWFDEEAMTVWWEEHMLPWVDAALWDEQVYTPLRQNMRNIHWKAFITWWDTSIKDWWTNHLLKPWCQNSKWDTDIYNPIKKNMRDIHWKDFIKWWDEVIKDWWENHLLRPWAQTNKWDTDIYTPIKRNMRDVHWKDFMSWWDDSIKNWWNEHFVHPYATDQKWNNDVYTPIKTNMRDVHWKDFLQWWDNTLRDWWNNHFMPWVNLFKLTIADAYDYLLKLTQVVFTAVKDVMIENINTAKDSVVEACAEMADAVREVIALIEELLRLAQEAMSLGIDIGGFAEGGFVSAGDLFIANEAGAELIGTIGGHTAVASNQEITGIADAVYSTGNQESQLLNELININRQILDKEQVVIGDKEIAMMANNGQDQLGMVIIS